jgi:hypothetical protein
MIESKSIEELDEEDKSLLLLMISLLKYFEHFKDALFFERVHNMY